MREFLIAAGLTQAVRGFDADMVVMNPSFERDVVPGALDDLLDSLVVSYSLRLCRVPLIFDPPRDSELIATGKTASAAVSEPISGPTKVGACALTSRDRTQNTEVRRLRHLN